jgi:hypothetical protein
VTLDVLAAHAAFGADAEPPSLAEIVRDWASILAAVAATKPLAAYELQQSGPRPVRMDPDGLLHLNAGDWQRAGFLVDLSVDLALANVLTGRYRYPVHVRTVAAGTRRAIPTVP